MTVYVCLVCGFDESDSPGSCPECGSPAAVVEKRYRKATQRREV